MIRQMHPFAFFLLFIGLFGAGSASGQETLLPSPYFGQTKTVYFGEISYTLRLLVVKDAGVIGVELTWHNPTKNREMIERRGSESPVVVNLYRDGAYLPQKTLHPSAEDDEMISIPNGQSVKYLEPNGIASFFVPLNSKFDAESVSKFVDGYHVVVSPRVHLTGQKPRGIDSWLKREIFTGCALTPAGLKMDAQKLYQQALRGEKSK